MTVLLRMAVREEHDIFVVRQRGREVAAALGMERQDQVRVATALSEVGRQMLENGGAAIEFDVRDDPRPSLAIVVSAPGIRPSEGLAAAERLMDVEVSEDRVVLSRRLPSQLSQEMLARIRAELALSRPTTVLDELSVQNQQLVTALEEVQGHRDELLRMNEELEETNQGVMALYGQLSQELEQTNQGVVALYAELEERSAQLREASEAKSRFLANVSHELRAPVTAVIGLTRLLLDPRSDPLTEDQGHQLQLVQTSAADLLARVNDLLDLAKAEANRIEPQWAPVDLVSVFGQLRGTLRSMAKPGVELNADELPDVVLISDEVLLSQIMRNLFTNALKFTVAGEVRLSTVMDGDRIRFVVADTGIGIPPDEQARVFEEFHQVRGAQQIGSTGTGLGLPYARRLTALLGGRLTMTSVPDEGSVFTVDLPLRPEPVEVDLPWVAKALVVAADRRAVVEALAGMAGAVAEAADVRAAVAIAARELPDVVFVAPPMTGLLDALAEDDQLVAIPVVVIVPSDFPKTFPRATVVLDEDEVNQGVMATVLRAIGVVDEP